MSKKSKVVSIVRAGLIFPSGGVLVPLLITLAGTPTATEYSGTTVDRTGNQQK